MNPKFSKTGYFSILEYATSANYSIVPLKEAMSFSSNEKILTLRHDVDFSLNIALELAKLESSRGFKSTYFILPYNDFYNPLSPTGRKILVEIKNLGHEIGLHWDSSLYDKNTEIAYRQFSAELLALEDILGEKIYSASQHVPIATPFLNVEHLITYEAYSQLVQRKFTYVSDSLMSWRDKTPFDLIDSNVNIHFLAHPVWWITNGITIREKIKQILKYEFNNLDNSTTLACDLMEKLLKERDIYDLNFHKKRSKSLDSSVYIQH